MDYKKKYDEALKRAKEIKSKILSSHLSTESCKAVSEYIDEIIPELCESEDERIRKGLVNFLQSPFIKENLTDEKVAPWIAYLEKQKEQKPLSTEETELNSIAFLEQMGYTCVHPKKEHQNDSDAPKNALGGALNSPLDKDKNLDDIAQDYVEAVKEYNPEPTWNLMQTAVCYGYHYREEEEQKPAEWSEEDERIIDTIVSVLGQYIDYKAVSGTGSGYATPRYNKEIDWLRSLRPSWKPSEEQMEALAITVTFFKTKWTGAKVKEQLALESLYGDLEKLM